MASKPLISWNERSGVFLGVYGNIRFAVTPEAAKILSDALLDALALLEAKTNG